MKIENEKLKPCPFCGGPVNVYYSSATKAFFWIHTDRQGKSKDCIETTPDIMHGKYESINEAYTAWNRRADNG